MFRQILSISLRTRGRPQELPPPEGGWGCLPVAEAGTYLVSVGETLPAPDEAIIDAPVGDAGASVIRAAIDGQAAQAAGWQALLSAAERQAAAWEAHARAAWARVAELERRMTGEAPAGPWATAVEAAVGQLGPHLPSLLRALLSPPSPGSDGGGA